MQNKELPSLLSSRELYRARRFQLCAEEFRLPAGDTIRWSTIKHPGAVVVLPVTNEGEIVVLRQFRYPLRDELTELCAGTLEVNENPLECAKRELAEELGLTATDWSPLGEFFTMPGACDEKIHAFLARGLNVGHGEKDEGEIISSVFSLSVKDFAAAIARCEIQDAKSVTAFTLASVKGLLG